MVTAPPVTVAVGSVADVATPDEITSLTELVGEPDASVLGLSAQVHQGVLRVIAANTANAGQATLVAHAVGCTTSGCGRPVEVTVPVTIRSLEAPDEQLTYLTDAAPERVAEAENSYLPDELIITVGTPEAPGTRAQADAAGAQAHGGIVSGGIESSGIYQIRWRSPQDLPTRKAELEAISVVTSVSYSSVGAYEITDAYPVAQPFQHQEFTWPYSQVHAQEAWAQTTGSNITVGVIDEADVYRDDEDLNVAKAIGTYTPPFSSKAADPAHASHVAGLACARNNTAQGGGPQLGMVGMAWGCPIVTASLSNSSTGMLDLMEDMARDPSVRVVNISIGRRTEFHKAPNGNVNRCVDQSGLEDLEQAIADEAPQFRAFLAGAGRNIVWVTSAGNSCASTVGNAWGMAGAPLPNVIPVAATNSDETLAVFSNYGAGVKVAAPGGFAMSPQGNSADTAGLMSSVPGVLDCPYAGYCPALLCTHSECSEYEEMAGTSMASPIVAGIAALAVAGNPGISADQIGTCVTGSAGAAGTPGVSDYTVHQSHVYPSHWLQAGHEFVPELPEGEAIPIVDAAAAVECRHRHLAAAFRGSGGGDGWAVALSSSAVFNVFHHDPELQVACHFQADAEPCWEPETITDDSGNPFATSGQPGLWLDQATGKLYVFATRWSDQRAGVVCIDTVEAFTNPDPFCGFTALTGEEESPPEGSISTVSDPTLVGSRWFAFNYVNGAPIAGSKNKLLCFDVGTHAPCPGQPFAVSTESGAAESGAYPPPAVAGIGSKVIVPLRFSGGEDQLACFDGTTESACPGAWPVDVGVYDSEYGAAFPLLDGSGGLIGLCLPTGIDPCYSLTGASVATPSGMPEAVPKNSGWNGPGVVLGTKVYVPNGLYDAVDCYDYATDAPCASYPLQLTELGLLYTVSRDPERPGCLWVNSDDGTAQIQNFEAATGNGICE